MLYYYYCFMALFIINLVFRATKNIDKNKLYLFLSSIPIVVLAGLKGQYIGSDTPNYFAHYEEAVDHSLKYMLENGRYEIGYQLYVKALTFISYSPHFLFFITAIVFISCVCIFIYNNSSDMYLSFMLYMTLGFFAFSLSGIRQTIAIGICLLSFESIKQRKPFKFLLIVLIAATFHTTAIIFIPAYFIAYRKVDTKSLIITAIIFVTIIFGGEAVITYASSSLGYKYGIEGSEGGEFTALILLVLFVGTLIYKKNILKRKESNIVLINLLLITLFMWYLRSLSQIVERASFYYFITVIALVPEIVYSVKNKLYKSLIYILVICASLYFFYHKVHTDYSIYPYSFFFDF